MSRIGRKDERIAEIIALLEKNGVIRLRDAAAHLGVSEMTIRRDLSDVPGRFNCLGGYIISVQEEPGAGGYVAGIERDTQSGAKHLICARAAALIEDDDTIFIDCGTTTPHLAELVPQGKSITVICYSLIVAEIIMHLKDVRLILLGGVYHRAAGSFSSDEAIDVLKRININKAFISAGGVHEQHGVTCSHFHEVPIKQMAIRRAVDSYLMVDSSKFGKVRAAHFAEMSQFRTIISDKPELAHDA
ncbi:DeoR/GlpR family DNA-binding transcription regulator [Rhizobiaceae bacterium n13]|uniref:DeoR/GlpR family DNA-binding transcription regulator n=1 Tax=Ferirhizobium litorale TaxID=2927786 RepID=A0AAE3QFH1_9HYPH|nr:DeoR/GlpR family DNA-binding transcription regulator [Fererhizobium litorale]MDI7862162.1 DeoR/GlpR family DNA-binding transcription regulator [Fererhizobium litorale]MDI7922565.1 DeoR/GlpR family DNA-binding transcription regulator [Fererhizobium litorale]